MKTTLLLPVALSLVVTVALANDPLEPIPGLSTPTPLASASPDPFAPEERARRFAATEHLHIPLPKTTPYDAHPAARKAYLKAYRIGYRRVMSGVILGCGAWAYGTLPHDAIITGDEAGQRAAELFQIKHMHDAKTSNLK